MPFPREEDILSPRDDGLYPWHEEARQRYLSSVVSSDDILVASQEIKLEIAGSSEDSIEGAVSDALAEASTVLPGLKRVETTALEADIDDGQVSRWHVKLKAVLDRRA